MAFFHNRDTERDPVTHVTFSPEHNHYTILFVQEGTNYRALALPDDTDSAPPGKARVINFTADDIALRYNESGTIVLKPHKSKILSAAERNLLIIEMAYNEDKKWVKSGYRYIPLPPEKSTTIFYVQSDADFFKTADGLAQKGPQSLILRQVAK